MVFRYAAIIIGPILFLAGGYALGAGAPGIAVPVIAATFVLLGFLSRTHPDTSARTRVGQPVEGNALQTEIARSRRHNRSFALLRVPWGLPTTRAEPLASQPANDVLASLQANIRVVDHVWGGPDGVYVLLPESGPEEARSFLARLATKLSPEIVYASTTATYPQDGPTEQGLLRHVRERHGASIAVRPGVSTDPHHPLPG